MNEFSTTTTFQLIRRLAAAGPNTPTLYLLLCEAAAMDSVRADIEAEVQVQFGFIPRSFSASGIESDPLEKTFAHNTDQPLVLITFDHWIPGLFRSFDRNIVLLKEAGTVLLIASRKIAERALATAPNMRNRFTDVLWIKP
jgi:hypothetical protein